MSHKSARFNYRPERTAKTLRALTPTERLATVLDGPAALALDYGRAWFAAHDGRLPAPSVVLRVAVLRLAHDLDRLDLEKDLRPLLGDFTRAAKGQYGSEQLLAAGRARLEEGVSSFAEALRGPEELARSRELLAALEASMERHERDRAQERASRFKRKAPPADSDPGPTDTNTTNPARGTPQP